jgi:dihydroorotate dehydrogenase (fumarate)
MLENALNAKGIDAIELNMACPNIPGKSITAYDFDMMDNTLKAISSLPQFASIPVGVKLPPYFDIAHVHSAATVLSKYPIRFVVCCNSIPNGLFVDAQNECEAIAANNGLGGLSGGFIKHTALANVRMMYKALKACGREDIDIVGVGGVAHGRDAFELILCGATAVQVGTCHWTEGAKCFERIASELEAIMKTKGYHHIEDFRGKLKPYVKPALGGTVCETVNGGDVERREGDMMGRAKGERGSADHVFLLSIMSLIIVVLVVALSYTSSHGYFNIKKL